MSNHLLKEKISEFFENRNYGNEIVDEIYHTYGPDAILDIEDGNVLLLDIPSYYKFSIYDLNKYHDRWTWIKTTKLVIL